MFSATFSEDIQKLAGQFLRRDYLFVSVGIVGAACRDITQSFLEVNRKEKRDKLLQLLTDEGIKRIILLKKDYKKNVNKKQKKRGTFNLRLHHLSYPKLQVIILMEHCCLLIKSARPIFSQVCSLKKVLKLQVFTVTDYRANEKKL